ncbi:MAG: aspartate ammonia-lyase [Bacilli bacterium]
MRYRIEKDSLGELKVPAEVYYGIQTLRGKDNFEITKRGICRQMIKSLVIVKKAAAKANLDAGLLNEKVAKAIMAACDEILNGRLHGQFVTDLIQGGAGTSMNMNANEVIANRAEEMLGGNRGEYLLVHPLDHVNCSQSTNDVIPTAGKIAIIKQLKKTIVELKKLYNALLDKGKEFENVIKIGRTHLQEAVPITLGREFTAYAGVLSRDIKKLELSIDYLSEVNMGATAIGTSLNANSKYLKKVVFYLTKFSGEELRGAKDLVDATRHLDSFNFASSMLKITAVDLSKMASDLRLMSSLGEIKLPSIQPGSSIMPGKFNPVVPEVVNQVAFYIMGLDVTVTNAVEAGQLELNVFMPVILMSLFEEITTLRRAVRTFRSAAIEGLSVNPDIDQKIDEHNVSLATVLAPHIGYDTACEIILEANQSHSSVKELVVQKKLLTKEEADTIFNLEVMTKPGIVGEELMKQKKEKGDENE